MKVSLLSSLWLFLWYSVVFRRSPSCCLPCQQQGGIPKVRFRLDRIFRLHFLINGSADLDNFTFVEKPTPSRVASLYYFCLMFPLECMMNGQNYLNSLATNISCQNLTLRAKVSPNIRTDSHARLFDKIHTWMPKRKRGSRASLSQCYDRRHRREKRFKSTIEELSPPTMPTLTNHRLLFPTNN